MTAALVPPAMPNIDLPTTTVACIALVLAVLTLVGVFFWRER
jgi:hypothetical protein